MSILFVVWGLAQAMLARADAVEGLVVHAVAAPCASAGAIISSCEAATTSFDYFAGKVQASCLCYSGNSWVPNVFDNAILSCANYVKTATPTDYSSIAALESFCSYEGDVKSAPKTTAATTTTPATRTSGATATPNTTLPPAASACLTVFAAISSCETATPGFLDLVGSQQASCVCYDQSTWVPSSFDGNVLTCAGYMKTADPTDYPDMSSLQSFCSKKGDVRAAGTGLSTGGSATRSVVVVTNAPATPSLQTSTGAANTNNVVIVTASSANVPTVTATSAAAAFSHNLEGSIMYLSLTFALATLGMCILL